MEEILSNFMSNLYENTRYSAIQKLSDLQNYLTEEASDIVKHLNWYPVTIL